MGMAFHTKLYNGSSERFGNYAFNVKRIINNSQDTSFEDQ